MKATRPNRSNATANDAFRFIGSGAFSNVACQLQFVQSGVNTYVKKDVNGDALADSILRLNGQFALKPSDFVL